MSTRCNILIKDKKNKQWFYRHCDGYPSVTANSLKTFVQWLIDGKIRDSVSQGSSWLIILGNNETNKTISDGKKEQRKNKKHYFKYDHESYGGGSEPHYGSMGWKVGVYEITNGKHGDIEYIYTIDMDKKTVKIDPLDGNTIKYTFKEFVETDHK